MAFLARNELFFLYWQRFKKKQFDNNMCAFMASHLEFRHSLLGTSWGVNFVDTTFRNLRKCVVHTDRQNFTDALVFCRRHFAAFIVAFN